MTQPPAIAPRHSIAIYAACSLLMVIFSYLFVVAVALACAILPFLLVAATRGNVQLVILFIGGVIVCFTLLWSLLPRWEKYDAPGLLLDRGEHPKLFAQLDDISSALNEKLPQEVYLIGNANAFVANRGGTLGMGGRRIMAIGLPLLSTLTVSEFRAVLAHEFAHYYGGDTKLGPLVYKAHGAMSRTFQNVAKVGTVARVAILQLLHLVVTLIIKWQFILFLRVLNFISRKQEFRADELACLVAGTVPMKEGLKRIHGAAVSWNTYWSTEVGPLLAQGFLPPVGAGFAKFLTAPAIAPQVEASIQKEISEGKTEPYDSHPPLRDRIAKIDAMPPDSRPLNNAPASELLENALEMEWKLLEAMNPKLKDKRLPFVEWHEKATRVVIPAWKFEIASNAGVFSGMTTETLGEAVKEMPALAKKFPDPKGRLPTPNERSERGVYLVSAAVALLLLEHGWNLEAQPGEFHIYRGEERVSVNDSIRALWKGELSTEEWDKRCEHWGIRGMSIVSAGTMAVLARKPVAKA